jgi:hypothetical protein
MENSNLVEVKRVLTELETGHKTYVYDFREFQKLKFNTIEIEMGYDIQTDYIYNDELEDGDNYGELVEIEDYEKYGLIDQKIFNLNELLKYSHHWENIESLISGTTNGEQFYRNIECMIENYLKDKSDFVNEDLILIDDFVIRFLIDGLETEIVKSYTFLS